MTSTWGCQLVRNVRWLETCLAHAVRLEPSCTGVVRVYNRLMYTVKIYDNAQHLQTPLKPIETKLFQVKGLGNINSRGGKVGHITTADDMPGLSMDCPCNP